MPFNTYPDENIIALRTGEFYSGYTPWTSSSNQTVKSPRRRGPSLYSAQLRTWYFFCFACLYRLRLGYFMVKHTPATTTGRFRSQPRAVQQRLGSYETCPGATRGGQAVLSHPSTFSCASRREPSAS